MYCHEAEHFRLCLLKNLHVAPGLVIKVLIYRNNSLLVTRRLLRCSLDSIVCKSANWLAANFSVKHRDTTHFLKLSLPCLFVLRQRQLQTDGEHLSNVLSSYWRKNKKTKLQSHLLKQKKYNG